MNLNLNRQNNNSGKFSKKFCKMEKFIKRQKTCLPIIIVEDHNDVLYHIYRAIGSKKIPFKDGLMIHFDSHPDLVVPKHLRPERILEKDYVINSLSIENWIIPAIFAGHFNTVAWIKPYWASQMEEGLHTFKIGVEEVSQEIKVTCTDSYFVSELSWCPADDLRDARDVTLQVCTLGAPLPPQTSTQGEAASGYSTAETEAKRGDPELCRLDEDIQGRIESSAFVLDIDLDFYSTRNPFYEIFNPQQFDILRKLYHYEHPKDLTVEALRETTQKRRERLAELKSIFECIRDGKTPPPTPLLEAVRPLLDTFPDGRPPNPDLLNDAGCTCDYCDLPHHVSSRDEVRHLVDITKTFLLRYPKPAIVTIARSSRDDYCPPEDVDFIQECVLEMLEEIYGDVEVSKEYEADQSEEETAQEGTS